jgi:hypothetical protein
MQKKEILDIWSRNKNTVFTYKEYGSTYAFVIERIEITTKPKRYSWDKPQTETKFIGAKYWVGWGDERQTMSMECSATSRQIENYPMWKNLEEWRESQDERHRSKQQHEEYLSVVHDKITTELRRHGIGGSFATYTKQLTLNPADAERLADLLATIPTAESEVA